MKTKITLLSLFLVYLLFAPGAFAQCTQGVNYPPQNYAALNNGTYETVFSNSRPGDYVSISNISTSRVYTFATSVPSDYITLMSIDNQVLAHGPSGLTYVPTSSTNIRYYIHLNSSCATDSSTRVRYVSSQPIPTCGAPTGLGISNITSNSCKISWTAPSTAPSGYDVFVNSAMVGPVPASQATATTTTNGLETLSGLNPGTNYYYWVRSSCGQQKGYWVYGGGFTTNAALTCNGAGYGLYPQATFTPACTGNVEQIAMSRAGEYSNVNVLADKQYTFETSVPTDHITITNAAGTTVYAAGTTPLVWSSSAVSGVVRYYIHTDSQCGMQNTTRERKIKCAASPCGLPSNITVSNITANSAKITWAAPSVLPSGGYEILLNVTGVTPLATATATQTAPSNIINPMRGLAQSTTYYYWVRSVCGTDKSSWVAGGNFTTNPIYGCNGAYNGMYPEQTFTPAGTGSSEVINNDAKGGQYVNVNIVPNRHYTFTSSATGDYLTVTSANGDVVYATGATPLRWSSNTYSGVVRYYLHTTANCAAEAVNRTRSITSAPIGSCPWPKGIVVSDITSNSALISWVPNSSETGLNYYVSVSSSPYTAPSYGSTTTGGTRPNAIVVNQLQPNTTYYLFVSKACNSGSSPWVSGGTFRTLDTIYISCNGAFYGLFPMETFTPACTGELETITSESAGGQFSYVNLLADKQYVFQSGLGTDYLTITNEAGTEVLAKGSSPMTWNSGAFSGKVRYYLHTQVACGSSSSTRSKFIKCIDNCVPPAAATVSNIAASSAKLWWTGNASNYQYYYSTSSTVPANNYPTTNNVLAERTADLSNLTPGATYYVWVRSVCGTTTTAWVQGQSFTTFAGGSFTGSLYPNASFIPTCNGGPETVTTFAQAAQYSSVQVTASTSYIFESSVPTDYITITNSDGSVLYAYGITPLTWSSNATTGTVRFYLHKDANCGAETTYRTKTVTCVSPNTCGLPTNVLVTNITSNSALLEYTAPATAPSIGYQFQATLTNTPPAANTPALANTMYTYGSLAGLAPNTTYYTWVRSVCITGAGLWVAGPSFTTIAAATTGCNGAENGIWPMETFTPVCSGTNETVAVGAYAGQFSKFNFVADKLYTFTSSVANDYVTITNETGTVTYASGTSPLSWYSATASGVARYYVHTNSSCGSNQTERTKSLKCATPVCDAVTNVLVSNITSNSARLWWAQAGTTGQYYLQVSTQNVTPTTNGSAINVNRVELNSLAPATTYYYWVRTNCGLGIVSAWKQGSFTTGNALACNGVSVPPGNSGLYPEQTFQPSCSGSLELITNAAWAGEFSNVAIVPNKTYIFTSSVATDYITITSADGNTVYSSGTTPVTWSSGNNTGTVRFFLHSDNSCGGISTSRSRFVMCADPCTSPVTPTFTQVAPICAGENLSALPVYSNEQIPGTWSPALNTSATTTYTFTPALGQCATTAIMTIVVNNPTIIPTFQQVGPICPGNNVSPLPVDSTNGIHGSWSPAINNMATTTYTFTPMPGQCALPTTMTIEATQAPNRVPTFTQVPQICTGGYLAPLPNYSNEQIFGEWTPQLNNQATTTYTFTPASGQCAVSTTMTITVSTTPYIVPTFDQVQPLCAGVNPGSLPVDSTNGINGSWSPALNNTATTTYTFTPAPGQCAVPTTMTIEVVQMPQAPSSVNSCGTYILPELPNGFFYSGTNHLDTPLAAGVSIYYSQTVYYYYDNIPCSTQGSFDVNIQASTNEVVVNGGTIAALMAGQGVTYQWYKCTTGDSTIIQGATSQGFTPTENGSYQVRVTIPGCGSVYSDCIVIGNLGNEDVIFSGELKIYPNPSRGQFTVETGTVEAEKITIFDNLGRIIKIVLPTSNLTQLDIAGCADGVYFVKIENKGHVSVKKVALKQ